jgi:Domain of unknown function (DUF4267)
MSGFAAEASMRASIPGTRTIQAPRSAPGPRIRTFAAALGLGTALFGVAPILAPRLFARLFGFAAPDPATASMMRSLGLRDAVMGLGLWSSAARGGEFAPWLLARALTDGGDSIAVALAVGAGHRNPRFLALGLLALAAALGDAALYAAARRSR